MHPSSCPGVQHGGAFGFIPQFSIGGVSTVVPTIFFSSLLSLDASSIDGTFYF
ncbi:MAG TPA: hypothetical protein VD815_01145 [Candidatus Saccharimonadales bacterium]|nr:hypothetical protein [Candidatus Saccharimonadales bacterium]